VCACLSGKHVGCCQCSRTMPAAQCQLQLVLNDCARVQPKQTTGFSNLFQGTTNACVLYVQKVLTISKNSISNARASHVVDMCNGAPAARTKHIHSAWH